MFSPTLLKWYDLHHRDLPWRHRKDAYAIWLSEVILQQTRIDQGMAYWERFLKRWPSVDDLAQATEDEVLRVWQGLGYYSRARNLHKAARQVVAMRGFPDTAEALCQLKGVGEYTAAAIASFAFGQQVAAIDGNAYRVLSRIFGISTPIDSAKGKRKFAALAQSLIPADRPADFNQAMMDFGALQCVPGSQPDCLACPFAETCVAHREHLVATLPVKKHKTKVATRYLTYLYIYNAGQTVIHQRSDGDIWQGLWEPMLVESTSEDAQKALAERILSDDFKVLEALATFSKTKISFLARGVKHLLTHRKLVTDYFYIETSEHPVLPKDFRWIEERDLDVYAKPRLVEQLLKLHN